MCLRLAWCYLGSSKLLFLPGFLWDPVEFLLGNSHFSFSCGSQGMPLGLIKAEWKPIILSSIISHLPDQCFSTSVSSRSVGFNPPEFLSQNLSLSILNLLNFNKCWSGLSPPLGLEKIGLSFFFCFLFASWCSSMPHSKDFLATITLMGKTITVIS